MDHRLLASNSGADEPSVSVELIHESLIESWPTLQRWLDESHADGLFRARLLSMARQWLQSNRPVGLLWRDESARDAERWRARYREPLTDVEQQYLSAVIEHARRAARAARSRRIVGFVVLAVIVVGPIAALVTIRRAEQEAVHQAQVARTEATRARDAEEAARQREREARRATQRAERVSGELDKSKVDLEAALRTAEQQTHLPRLSPNERKRQRSGRSKRGLLSGRRGRMSNARSTSSAGCRSRSPPRQHATGARAEKELAQQKAQIRELKLKQQQIVTKLK